MKFLKQAANYIKFATIILIAFRKDYVVAEPVCKQHPEKTRTERVRTTDIAKRVLEKGLEQADLGKYPGSLLLHGMAELAVVQEDDHMTKRLLNLFSKFKSREIDARANFISYEAGGSGAAYLYYSGKSDALAEQVLSHAEKMMREQKKTTEGLLTAFSAKEHFDQIFIDVAFAVTPYLLYSGLASANQEQVNMAVFETLELFKILDDPASGLLHQARGFNGLNSISEDNWSRGNGWGAFALAALVRDLPDNHPKKPEVNRLANRFFTAVLKHQNNEGMWHQEMTDGSSFMETSGSGLLLYGLGVAIEKGVLDGKHITEFKKGLSGYLSFIAEDGSVSHTCIGCLSPGKGTKQDYINHRWKINDSHAFGPVVLAFGQAAKMGIQEVSTDQSLGHSVDPKDLKVIPRTYVRYMPDANGNILWENDRVAFRMYGPSVKDRVGSGIDVWAKSVDYPIINKWYQLIKNGKSYHEDRGEGCDFFEVGFTRGNGGSAIWHNDKPFPSQTYSSHRIIRNNEQEIEFELTFAPWDVDGKFQVSEIKRISMKKGTNFFKVVSTFQTDRDVSLTAGIGIASSKTPQVFTRKQNGTLSVWESYLPKHGELGTAVIVAPDLIKGFKAYQKEQFMLVSVKSGDPITYYVGAGWSKSPQFKTKEDWLNYVESESKRLTF